ncbi:MAG: hypothetical protein WBP72_18900 [Rhodocyclaceae bacterium]
MSSDQVRELLHGVPYPGFSRDIVGAGFVGEILAHGPMVEVEFRPGTRDEEKVARMEDGIRGVLRGAGFADVQIRRTEPRVAESPLRSAKEILENIAISANGAPAGSSRLMTPLQAEFLEDGELPEADLLAIALGRMDVAEAAGYGPGGPQPLAGPREDAAFDMGMSVLQWDINPHDPKAITSQREIKLADWDYRVWWQVHPAGDLLYVSMQAMREDWVDNEDAVPHPVGRSEAVNLVYDEKRSAVIAIYGTVRDFRPFVKAFALAYAGEAGENTKSNEREGVAQ